MVGAVTPVASEVISLLLVRILQMVRLQTPTLMPIVLMPLLRAQMKKSRQSPFVGVPATNDHVRHATCVILRPGGSVDMKVRLTVALDKRGFVYVWRAGQ